MKIYTSYSWGQEEKGATEDEMVGCQPWIHGHEFEQTLGNGEGQGSLKCYSLWSHEESTQLSDWTVNKGYALQWWSSAPVFHPGSPLGDLCSGAGSHGQDLEESHLSQSLGRRGGRKASDRCSFFKKAVLSLWEGGERNSHSLRVDTILHNWSDWGVILSTGWGEGRVAGQGEHGRALLSTGVYYYFPYLYLFSYLNVILFTYILCF